MTRKTELTGSGLLLGGLAAGVAAMYLLDPERGEARRQELASKATEAFSSLGETAGQSLHGVTDGAGSAWSTLAAQARTLASTIGQHVSERAASATDAAYSAADTARTTAGEAYESARTRFGGAPAPGATASVAAAVTAPAVLSATTAALLGAAAVYFLDPDKGANRRQATYEAVNGIVTSAREMAERVIDRVKNESEQVQREYASSDEYTNDEGPEVGRSNDA